MQHFQTADPYEAEHFASAATGDVRVKALRGSKVWFRSSRALLPNAALFSVRAANLNVLRDTPSGVVSVTVPLDAAVEAVGRSGLHVIGPGAAHILNGSDTFDYRHPVPGNALVANFFPSLLNGFVARLNGERETDAPPFELGERISLTTPAGRAFWRFLNFPMKVVLDFETRRSRFSA